MPRGTRGYPGVPGGTQGYPEVHRVPGGTRGGGIREYPEEPGVGEFSSDLYHALACDIKNTIFFNGRYTIN